MGFFCLFACVMGFFLLCQKASFSGALDWNLSATASVAVDQKSLWTWGAFRSSLVEMVLLLLKKSSLHIRNFANNWPVSFNWNDSNASSEAALSNFTFQTSLVLGNPLSKVPWSWNLARCLVSSFHHRLKPAVPGGVAASLVSLLCCWPWEIADLPTCVSSPPSLHMYVGALPSQSLQGACCFPSPVLLCGVLQISYSSCLLLSHM